MKCRRLFELIRPDSKAFLDGRLLERLKLLADRRVCYRHRNEVAEVNFVSLVISALILISSVVCVRLFFLIACSGLVFNNLSDIASVQDRNTVVRALDCHLLKRIVAIDFLAIGERSALTVDHNFFYI